MAAPAEYKPSKSVREIILCSFRSSTNCRLSTPSNSAAMRTGHRSASHCLIGPTEERPDSIASQMVSTFIPAPQTAPIPLMTIRDGELIDLIFRSRVLPRPLPDGGKPDNYLSHQNQASSRARRGCAFCENCLTRYPIGTRD